jgi:hypothetical protein
MLDEGFIGPRVTRFGQIVDKYRDPTECKSQLAAAVSKLAHDVPATYPQKAQEYFDTIAGRLKLLANVHERDEPNLPNKLTDPQLNKLGKASMLREAIEMIKSMPSKP